MMKMLPSGDELEVNITSLVDVIFILLIFFMVSTQFKKNALPLDLPASTDKTELESNAKTLTITGERILLDGAEIAFENLEDQLSSLYEKERDLEISLECEKSVEFERVVQIITKVQAAGISKIGIIHETVD